MEIHGCRNGLICYTNYPNIYLWNPGIRKLKVLPKYPDYYDFPIFRGADSSFRLSFGFWFDKRMNDYMVAMISSTNAASFVDIYSLSSNSWRIISHSIPGMFDTRGSSLQQDLEHVAGTLHWPAKTSSSYMIYSLDIKTGTFRDTLLPWGSDNHQQTDIYLTAIAEHSLAVFKSEIVDKNWRCLIVLVYDQNLNKLYTIDMEKDTCHALQPVVGLRNNGEALFPKLKHNDSGIISCTIETKEFEEFVSEIDYRYGDCKLERVRPFIQTLVLLNDKDAKKVPTPNYEETYFKTDSGCNFDYIGT